MIPTCSRIMSLQSLRRNTVLTTRTLSRTRAMSNRKRNLSNQTPSTIDSGFILSLDRLPNPATSDAAYQRLLSWYLPQSELDKLQPRLERFGEEAVSDQVNEWISNAERQQPYVKSRNVWGEKYPYDRLVTSEGWKRVGAWGIRNG